MINTSIQKVSPGFRLTIATLTSLWQTLAAFSTDAYLAIAPMQDYLGLGSKARINTPGIAGENWRWRVNATQLSTQFCDNIALLVTSSLRGNSNEPRH